MKNISTFLNELRLNEGAIWLEDNSIKLSVPPRFQNDETKNFLQENKKLIISTLNDNGIFSLNDFLHTEILKYNSLAYYPLSHAQERLWFIEQYDSGSAAYHIPSIYELEADTNVEGLKYALQQIVSRHEVLRTTIEQFQGQTIQRVHNEPLQVEEKIIINIEACDSIIKSDINCSYDLTVEYPIRVKIYTVKPIDETFPNKKILLINIHHIASDGWSMEILERELSQYYHSFITKNSSFSLPALSIQYKDYSVWQRTYITSDVLEKQLDYWKNKLYNYQTLEFAVDYQRGNKVDYRGSNEYFAINKETSQKLRYLSQKHGVTMHSVMLSALSILLGKYTNQDDIVTGSPTANRHHRQTRDLVGFFINVQVNRILLNSSQSFEDLLIQVHQHQIEAQLHQDLPFEKLLNELHVERDASRHPIFQIIFEVEGFGKPDGVAVDQRNYIKPYEVKDAYNVERFDISIFIDDDGEEITGMMSYAISLFHQDTIVRFIHHYIHLLDQLVLNPSKPYSQSRLMDISFFKKELKNNLAYTFIKSEYNQLLFDFNSIPPNYDGEYRSVVELFTQQVDQHPDAPALFYEGIFTSYRELDEQSSNFANYLQNTHDIKTNSLVGILLDRSDKLLICILGILKSGGAYLPIDPSYPQARKSYILNDAKINLLVTQTDYMFELDYYQGAIFAIDVQLDGLEKIDFPFRAADKADFAYVIYTSGSTGQPKGCAISHSNLSHYIQWANSYYFLSKEHGNFALYTSLSFDLTVTSIFCTLSRGKCLTIYSQHQEFSSILQNSFSKSSGVDSIKITPSHIKLLEGLNLQSSTMAQAIVGGESLSTADVQVLKKINPSIRIYNEYGPTETTVGCVVQELDLSEPILIGKPIFGTKIYILNPSLDLLPMGAIGEICIGGLGVSAGYLNKEELTNEKFVSNPFIEGERMYRTGDLGRWLSDGRLDYKGRNDGQVKMRGYRIELGEIEHALLQVSGIKHACVVAKDRKTGTSGVSYLVAYYTLDDSSDVCDQALIIDSLSKVLPEYMVPSFVMELAELPLTANGKLNRDALPDPEFDGKEEYIKPETELEKKLSDIYADILGLTTDQISTHLDFFRMGGSSILSIQLKQRLNQFDEFKHISVADLFKHSSIKKLIQSIQQNDITTYNLPKNRLKSNNHEIAIVGASGAFSGADDITEFWQLIANQQEGVHFYSEDECRQLKVSEALLSDPNFIPVSGKVKDIELFDPMFWDISPNEAKQLDPQIRKFIEHSWLALELSGYVNQRKNLNIGVFAGSGISDYFYEHVLQGEMAAEINTWEAYISNSKDALTTKTAFFLDLSGPAISINTACSTGLVSVVEACKNLQVGSCNMALAGGVSLSLPDEIGYVYEDGMILSKDGSCRTFDNEASGTLQGSGVGVILLKRLEDAVKDNDVILGVIKGYASNNDGARKTGYTAPSVIGQSECIITAQQMAGITADKVDYVECHGTATHIGDPIEVKALREAFEYNKSEDYHSESKTVLGAVKANIGHTDAAAGIASLIKVCSMLKNNIMPGQANFNIPNPELHLNETCFKIIKENTSWPPQINKQRIAGVSSFGIGGTNAHVIIGDYMNPFITNEGIKKAVVPSALQTYMDVNYIIPLSAKSRLSLQRYKEALLNYLTHADGKNVVTDICDIAYTLQERKEHFNYRSAFSAKNIDELANKLKLDGFHSEIGIQDNIKTVFMFPGQGAQYIYMAKALYDNEQVFKNCIDECIVLANRHLDVDLLGIIYPPDEPSKYNINDTQWTQVSLFIVEYALSTYLNFLGVKADAYIGHSVGEYVAATLSGVFSLEDAIRLVIIRGQLMQSMEAGSMLAIQGNKEVVQSIINQQNCEIAVINSIEDIVATGNHESIHRLKKAFDEKGISTIKLNTSHAYHSKMMEQAAFEFEKVVQTIQLNKPTKKFISNLSGEIVKEEILTPRYWSDQLRNTVQFAKGIDTLSSQFNQQVNFIEVGPGKGLCSFVSKYKSVSNYRLIQAIQLLPSLKELQESKSQIVNCKEDLIAILWMNGIVEKPNATSLFKDSKLQQGLPLYQFNFQKCWLEKGKRIIPDKELTLLPEENWLSTPVWSALAKLNDHFVSDNVKFKSTLVFLREDQIDLFDLTILTQNIQLIILVVGSSEITITDGDSPIKLNPENENHFKKLAEYLKTTGVTFETILHLSSIDNVLDPNEALCYSFYSLFLIRQYLLNNIHKINLLILTNGLAQITNVDVIHSFNGTLVGAVRNISHEFININAGVIDIGHNQDNILTHLTEVINNQTYQKWEELLAIRFGRIWLQRFERVAISSSKKNIFENGDVILITGGLGAIALSVAKLISSKNNVKFILVGDNNILKDNEQLDYIKVVEVLKLNGSSVDIQSCDISVTLDVQSLIDNVSRKHGSITGIIHTAGAFPLDMGEYSINNIKNCFKEKVHGINNVINVLKNNSLKFISSTSSLASIMGDINRIEYCAANSYLDYMAADRLKFKKTNIISVNWPLWIDNENVNDRTFNFGENVKPTGDLQKLMQLNSFGYKEGAELLYRLINQTNYEQVVVSKLDIDKLKVRLFKQNALQPLNKQITVLENEYLESEYQLAQIFADILGIEQISINDDFFKIGGNSILAIKASHRISNVLGNDVKVSDVFRLKSCKALVENIKFLEIPLENIEKEF